LLGCVIALLGTTNQFSLHAMYRARLIRAYLGASNGEESRRNPSADGQLRRNPSSKGKPRRNPFTGFDEGDDIKMADLWPTPRPSSSSAPATAGRRCLFHVVNMALNLVHGDRLAWQERQAPSLPVSALPPGGPA